MIISHGWDILEATMEAEKSDDDLMALIALGEEKPFQILFDRHAGILLGYCMRLLGGNKSLAEDITQEVWMKIVENAPKYVARGTFRAWAKTILRNTTFNYLEKNNKQQPNDELDQVLDPSTNIENALIDWENQGKLRNHLDLLPEKQRHALVLFIQEDLSYEEISRVMGVSVSSVKTLIYRAKQDLKLSMESA